MLKETAGTSHDLGSGGCAAASPPIKEVGPTVLSLAADPSGLSRRTATAILAFPPHRLVAARCQDGLDQFSRPGRPPQATGPSGPRFNTALPSQPVPVEERGYRNADHLGGLACIAGLYCVRHHEQVGRLVPFRQSPPDQVARPVQHVSERRQSLATKSGIR